MYDTNGGLGLNVRWTTGSHAVNYDAMFGTDNEAAEYDTGGAFGYIQINVPMEGTRVQIKPYIKDNIGLFLNFGKKIENVGLSFDTADSSVVKCTDGNANIDLRIPDGERFNYAIAIDQTGKVLMCDSLGQSIRNSSQTSIDLSDFFQQMVQYWVGIGFNVDGDGYLHIPASALTPAATGCYIKKEYLPESLWVRLDIPTLYQIPVVPLF